MEVKEWIKNLTEEHEEFKKIMHESDISYVYRSYEKIMLYETVFSYLIATEDDNFIGIRISDVYNYYINNDVYDIALTNNDDLIKLLCLAYQDYEREMFYKKYEDEYEDFQKVMILSSSKEVFEQSEKIYFYNRMFSYIQNEEYYELKRKVKDKSIAYLYNQFKESEHKYGKIDFNDVKNFFNYIWRTDKNEK